MSTPTSDPEATPTCYRHKDRETLVSCSNCERPICPSCMTQAAVGVRCPECSGKATGVKRLKPRAVQRGTTYVTMALIAINVVAFLAQSVTDAGSVGRGIGGSVSTRGWIEAFPIADGEWWRIITGAFLHGGVVHLAFNMIALWYLGNAFESYIGPLRFSLVYLSSVLWGSAGALLMSSAGTPTVGASGGVFGLMAAVLVLERQRGVSLLGDVGLWLGINLVITFALPGISIGGHLGGIVGGALAAFALSAFGKHHMAARKLRPVALVATLGVIVVGAVAGPLIADRKVGALTSQAACVCVVAPPEQAVPARRAA